MNCPQCSKANLRVIWTRPSKGYPWVMRRRECRDCKSRFTTSERVVEPKAGQPDRVAG